MSVEEEVARAIAVTRFGFVNEYFVDGYAPAEEWNERLHFKVPIILYKAEARAAIEKFRELTVLPDEVESVARALWHDEAMQFADIPVEDWEKVEGYERENFLRQARAALLAVSESRRELEEENERLLGEINDVLSILASRGYEVNKDRSLIRNVRPYLKTPQEMDDGSAKG